MAAKKEAAANEQQVTTQTTPAAEAEDIIAKAKAEAAAIVAEAQAKAKETLEAAKETAPAAPKPNDLVPIRLFKDNDKYKDDVFVAVNGRSFQIKRGETVQVPAYVAEVLEQSMAQDNATANLIAREQRLRCRGQGPQHLTEQAHRETLKAAATRRGEV